MSDRVGPYEVVREVLRAPGAILAEARDASGQPRLLQLTRLRGALSEDDRERRQKHEKVLAQRTMELIGDADIVVHAHGGADVEGGERVLFWALPWSDAPFLIDRAKGEPLSSSALIAAGVALAQRMAARHASGRVDPLLSEYLLRAVELGRPEVIGVPIALDAEWMAPDMISARVAPEEMSTQDRRPSGDVWRLGKLLLALAEHTRDLAEEARAVFAQLSDDDAQKRTPSAPSAVELLSKLDASARSIETPAAEEAPKTAAIEERDEPRPSSSAEHSVETAVVSAKRVADPSETTLRDYRPAPSRANENGHAANGDAHVFAGLLPNPLESSSWEIPTLTPARDMARAEDTVKEMEMVTAQARAMVADHTPAPISESEAITSQSEPQTPSPIHLPSILVDRTDTAETGPRLVAPAMPIVAHAIPTDGAVRALHVDSFSARDTLVDAPLAVKMPEPILVEVLAPRISIAPTEKVEPETPIPSSVPVLLPFEPTNNERAREIAPMKPVVVTVPAEKKTNGNHPVAAAVASMDPLAASWAQPVLPAGESPWSEVVQARGTHHRDRSDFPGFPDDVPVPARITLEKRATSFDMEDAGRSRLATIPIPEIESRPAYSEVPTSEIEVELAAALKGIDKRKVVSGVLVALVIFGLFAFLSRAGSKTEPREAAMITAANEVTLDSDPPGATVVAEADGQVLGKTPIRFLIAPESDVAVYLVAPSREPLRLALPSRGGLTAKLSPIDASDCVVTVTAPGAAELEGIDVDIGSNAERHVPGAAVVRAKAEQSVRGARLVLCPGLGGEKEQELRLERVSRPVAVRVTQPEGAAAYLNGDPIGPVPGIGRTATAFSRVRIDDQNGISDERWVSTLANIEVRMPPPRAKPVPHVFAPDGEREPPPSAATAKTAAVEKSPSAPEVIAAEETATGDDELPKTIQTPPAAKQKLTKAQRVIRARRLLKAGTKLLFAGKIERAKESLLECVDLDPASAECHRNLGMLFRKARSTHKAREHFTRYLDLAPNAADSDQIRKMIEN